MTKRLKVLTGVKPTGTPHLGNYFGSMRIECEPIGFCIITKRSHKELINETSPQ